MTSLLMTSNMDVRCKQRADIESLRHEEIKHVEIVETEKKIIKTRHFPSLPFAFKSPLWMMTAPNKTFPCLVPE